MRFAIQDSLVKPFKYLSNQKQDLTGFKEHEKPVGIFNHLYYMKTALKYEILDKSNFSNRKELLEEIY
jgi:hypothetical protein